MRFYTSVIQYGNKILVRGINNGKQVQEKLGYQPRLFVKAKGVTKYKSLFGDNLDSIKFPDINDAKDYVKKYSEVSNFPIFGNTNYAYQYITETFPDEIDYDSSQMKIWTLDIETSVEHGFPLVANPLEEIILFSIQDNVTKAITTFGIKPYAQTQPNKTYIHCANEIELLKKVIEFFEQDYPHIVTGWNVEQFDIAYLCARIEKMLGSDFLNRLSPWRKVNRRELDRGKSIDIIYDIFGISILDYLQLYKKFTYNVQESYKLDHIAKLELGAGKLDNPYSTFKEFYTKDWNLFVEYNIVDVERVDQLEDKMRLIDLIMTMAYDAKCNFVDIFSAVRTWDCILYNHLWKQNIMIPQKDHKPSRSIVGAYVQTPVPGQYDWVVSFDATSLYPSIIMQYNMSPETLITNYIKHFDITVEQLLKDEVNLSDLTVSNYAMASNGRCYSREKQGLFPEITAKLFGNRQTAKKLMLASQAKYEETKDKQYLNEISKFNNKQMAYKILLNSLFGAFSNEYFRFYDSYIAEGITMTGQYIIRKVAAALNEYLNGICGTTGFDYVFYSDTDSCYVTFGPLVQKYYKDASKEKIIEILDKICKEKIEKQLNIACQKLADNTNAFENKIFFKREAIADRGLWVAKKRYALNVYNNEGVQYAEPKLKVMGLEIVRSSTPEPIRKALKKAVNLALTSTEGVLQKYISDFEKEYMKMTPESVAFPRGVNGLMKYTDSSMIYKKGTPIHVRGSLLYNFNLKKHKLDMAYEEIKEGNKVKFIYLKEPNTIGENCIAFIGNIPVEFDIHKYIDYDLMFSKSFIEPLNTILEGIKWSAKPTATLEGLFT